ncbi:ATP-binding protein [bacterium]|nr:ATP-binding protein [bacterium]
MRELFPEHTYVSLDLPADAQMAEESPETFLSKYPPPLLLDEVQYAPALFRHLKVLIDAQREKNGEFILTGSQKFTLMKEVSESLAGRIALLELETFSVHEVEADFLESLETDGMASILCRGLYPGLWDNRELPRSDFFRSYLATYIERDVRQILNISSLRDFDRFMRVCATRSGQLLNKTDIAKEVGVSPKTINDWLSVLEASNQIVLLEPYFKNTGKRVVKSPKLYFTDCGLLTFLLGLNKENLLVSSHLGAVWQTFVFSELRKYLFLHHPESTLWFYRDQLKEADFLIHQGDTILLADAKWKEIPNEKGFESLISIHSFFEECSPKLTLITSTKKSFPVAENRVAVSGFHLSELFD